MTDDMEKMKFTDMMPVIAALLLAGCSVDNGPATWSDDPYAVKIRVTAGGLTSKSNPAADLEGPSKADLVSRFTPGDKVSVNDEERTVVYTLTEDGKWEPENGQYLKWKPDGPQRFKSFYPCDGNASFDGLGRTVSDQSSLAALQGADFMRSETIKTRIPSDRVLELKLYRQMARVVVKINRFNSQFGADEKVTDLKLFNSGTPYRLNGDGGTGSTYVYLTSPTAESDNGFISLTTSSGVSLKVAKVPRLQQGFSYTYNLNIGRDKIELAGPAVEDWNEGGVVPGKTQTVVPFSLEGASEESVTDDLNRITDDCIIKVTGEWADVLFSIFRGYLSSAKEPEITLDLSEVTGMDNELPEGAFASDCPTQSKLYGIILPDYVRKIKKKSLKNTNISSIDLTYVTFVDEYAFENCYELADVVWPEIRCTFIKSPFGYAKWKGDSTKHYFAPPFTIPSTVVYSNGTGDPSINSGFLSGGCFEQVNIPANYRGTYEYFMANACIKKIVVEGDVDSSVNKFLNASRLDTLDISNCSRHLENLELRQTNWAATAGKQLVVYVKTEELKAVYEAEYEAVEPKIIFMVKD